MDLTPRRHRVVLAGALALGLAAAALPLGVAAQEPLEMWERSGGNAPMVDELVRAWNEANPDRPIDLTYIEHAEMVPKLAQAIASGEVPDLMGLDLIYGPQFTSAGQLEDITDYFGGRPDARDREPRAHRTSRPGRTASTACRSMPTSRCCSGTRTCSAQAGLDPEKPPTNLQEIHDMAAKITASGKGNYGYYLPGNCAGCNIFTFGPLIWASGGTIEPAQCGDEPLVRATTCRSSSSGPADAQGGPHRSGRPGRERQRPSPSVRLGQGRHHGHRQLQRRRWPSQQNPDIDLGVTLLPGLETGQAASFAGGDIVTIPKGSQARSRTRSTS